MPNHVNHYFNLIYSPPPQTHNKDLKNTLKPSGKLNGVTNLKRKEIIPIKKEKKLVQSNNA